MYPGQPRRLRRQAASDYLKINWGIDRKATTLAKLASVGGGPKFEHAGRIPLYPEPELDAYAISILSPLKSSTSDTGEAGRKRAVERQTKGG
jgi:hypothetical protein